MVEFTEREIKIIHAMAFLQSPQFKVIPPEVKKNAVGLMLKARGMNFDENELIDLMEGIKAEQELTIKEAYGMLDKMGPMLKGFGKANIFQK